EADRGHPGGDEPRPRRPADQGAERAGGGAARSCEALECFGPRRRPDACARRLARHPTNGRVDGNAADRRPARPPFPLKGGSPMRVLTSRPRARRQDSPAMAAPRFTPQPYRWVREPTPRLKQVPSRLAVRSANLRSRLVGLLLDHGPVRTARTAESRVTL